MLSEGVACSGPLLVVANMQTEEVHESYSLGTDSEHTGATVCLSLSLMCHLADLPKPQNTSFLTRDTNFRSKI